ncbi:AAA-domain-containing protein [Punctularia strigosozonata HHB-11173 SS5]|uniref:AAA-domain-containing protein n=1 Tax=Punctularia strigosozonata (strain HHB-11173) TaxID=741275 RepID=UPI0004418589|nr:AAA-domain-containing protein [Punctularia strigosozonata HHB-11173 SS5]EIN06461.1 AAA-domain-containing protein [Punctularia strigosozonata HHB-11173 SS5]
MPRTARIHFVSLKSSLVNLPIAVYGPLVERGVRPQSLVVHLSSVSPRSNGTFDKNAKPVEAYVGWTGLASSSSLSRFAEGSASTSREAVQETVEIDPQFAQGLGLTAGKIVNLSLLYDLGTAQSVGTEPVSADDWEIIELHGSHIESTLLQQARVAAVGQELDVWVLGRTRVRLRVVSLAPEPKTHKALLLTADTEVSVAPKIRSKPQAGQARTRPSREISQANGSTSSAPTEKEERRTISGIQRVLPPRLARGKSISIPEGYEGRGFLYVSARTYEVLTGCSPLSARSKDGGRALRVFYSAKVTILSSPSEPMTSASAPSATPPATKVLNPVGSKGKADGSSSDHETNGPQDLLLGWAEGVPEKHVLLEDTTLDVQEWDLVRVTVDRAKLTVIPIFTANEDDSNADKREADASPVTLAGVKDILIKGADFCRTKFAVHGMDSVVFGVPGLLITGKSGSGKTSIAQAIARSLQDQYAYHHYVDASRHAEKPVGALQKLFKYWHDKALWHRPSVLVLDNIDKLLSAELEHTDSFRDRHVAELFLSEFGSAARPHSINNRGIVLIATAESSVALHPVLGTAHLFGETINLKPPNKEARRDILANVVQRRMSSAHNLSEEPSTPLNYTALATQTEGYSAIDLHDLVARAVHQATIRSQGDEDSDGALICLGMDDFASAQVDFVPLSLRDVKLQKSEVAWSDIGGLHAPKRILRETLEWPTRYGPIFAQSPLRLRSGILLYGFPGCGKTLLASAVARECGLNFISVKGPEILNKYIGASEQSVRDLFERASAAKPCVLFFDEFESIAPKRGHDSTGVTDRVVNQMLTQMDGAEGLDGVYVLAATSRPDLIDSALLRPGRLDKSVLCDMPNLDERREILESISKKMHMSSDVDLDEWARLTDGYSGADLQALIYNAHLDVIHSSIPVSNGAALNTPDDASYLKFVKLGRQGGKSVLSRAQETAMQRRLAQMLSSSSRTARFSAPRETTPKQEITDTHLRRVLQTTRPSVAPEERQRLQFIYHDFVDDRSGDLPRPPEPLGIGIRATLA